VNRTFARILYWILLISLGGGIILWAAGWDVVLAVVGVGFVALIFVIFWLLIALHNRAYPDNDDDQML
jgi:hypothetical protein